VPAVRRTSREQIVRAARDILERDGLDGLTMQAVATAVGIRAPSLYKHVVDRGDLVRVTLTDLVIELGERCAEVEAGTPQRQARALADVFRRFGHEHPVGFRLLFAPLPDPWRADASANARAAVPVLQVAERLAGPSHALDAARTLTATTFGFVSMELAGAFRLGGDVDAAWSYAVDAIIDALAVPAPIATRSSRARHARISSADAAVRESGEPNPG
jgi:AcrR family transcriptional regulator